jgi:hypothetical protein
MGAIDEGLGQIDLAAIAKVLGERLEDLHEHSFVHPLLHAAVAGLVRRVFGGKRFPRRTRPQNPQHSVEDATRLDARASLAVLSRLPDRDQRLDNTPLLIGELHVLLDHVEDPAATFLRLFLKSDRTSTTCQSRF